MSSITELQEAYLEGKISVEEYENVLEQILPFYEARRHVKESKEIKPVRNSHEDIVRYNLRTGLIDFYTVEEKKQEDD